MKNDDSTPSEIAQRNELVLRLADALVLLPEDQRCAVESHHLNGLTVAEVADEMGRSRASVAGLLRRGLNKLRSQLKDDSGPSVPPEKNLTESDDSTS